ncbi:MAG: TetR family transcriptional regulator [Dehalococcoidia bacterium]
MNYTTERPAPTPGVAPGVARAVRSGRRPAAAGDSRAEILAAARSLFAARGFRGTTTRQIAERAHVDIALIHHFFGTKAELFQAAIRLPQVGAEIVATLEVPGNDLAERVARLYLERLFTNEIETFSAVLRTAVGDPNDVPALRDSIYGMLQRVAAQLAPGGGDSTLALELVGAQMLGVLVMRHLVRLEPMASATTDELVRYLAPAFRALLRAAGEERSA